MVKHMSSSLRQDLPPRPGYMQGLPLDARGYPVPWFVAFIDGKPDFRVIRENGIVDAVNKHKCWLCGQPLGRFLTFVIGPMCAVSRTISEPPSHLQCAEFAAQACPFLTTPAAKRNERDPIPADAQEAAGVGLKRNPGAVCLWTTKSYRIMRVANGLLFRIGDPKAVAWYAHGRQATRGEVLESIESGLPLLREAADMQPGGPEALNQAVANAMHLLPAIAA